MTTIYRGHVFHVTGSPELEDAPAALVSVPDGQVVVDDSGVIVTTGPRSDDVPAGANVIEAPFILPGFVDTHIHFPQVHAIAACAGGELLEWLEHRIFPAEARLGDPDVASDAARDFVEALVSAGTTSAFIYGSQFAPAQAALFEEVRRRGLRAVIGRTTMTVGPEGLITGTEDAVRLCREEIDRHHPASNRLERELVHVALIPRFALSLTTDALRALGELWEEVKERGVFFSTHLSESGHTGDGEIAQVLRTFRIPNYLDAYDGRFLPGGVAGGPSFLSERSVFAHVVHATNEEHERLAARGCSVAHCPTSQLFLGNGTMPLARLRAHGVSVALGTDVAAGDTFSIPEVANAAFKVHGSGAAQRILHPAELLHLMTIGGAQALGWEHRMGNLDPDREADLVLVDPDRYPPLARRLACLLDEEASAEHILFALLMGMGRETILRTVVRGRTVHQAASS